MNQGQSADKLSPRRVLNSSGAFPFLLLALFVAGFAAPRSLRAAEETAEDSPPAVEEAGRSLGRWLRFPWYDSSRDDVKAVDYREHSYDPPDLSYLRVLGWVALAAVVAAALWLVISAWLNYSSEPRGQATVRTGSASIEHVAALPFLAARSTHDLLGQAQRHFAEGNYAEAIVFLFSYQLIELDRRNLIRLTKGKTNRQYLRELRSHVPLQELLAETMVVFEDVYFGNHPLPRERFETCWNGLPRFEALMASAATGASAEDVQVVGTAPGGATT